jgi:hypothetical protein
VEREQFPYVVGARIVGRDLRASHRRDPSDERASRGSMDLTD